MDSPWSWSSLSILESEAPPEALSLTFTTV
jgi:hypothetical protein